MIEEFFNTPLYIILKKEDVPRLNILDDMIGHIKFPSGETVNGKFTRNRLAATGEMAVIHDNGKLYYSAAYYKTAKCVTLDEFISEKYEIKESEFETLFE